MTRGASAALLLPLQAVQTAPVAALSGDRPPEELQDIIGRIAPRPVLLVLAGKGGGGEDLNRTYAARADAGTELWEIPEANHKQIASISQRRRGDVALLRRNSGSRFPMLGSSLSTFLLMPFSKSLGLPGLRRGLRLIRALALEGDYPSTG